MELSEALEDLESEWQPSDYHVFDKNCVHFADALGAKVAPNGVPRVLLYDNLKSAVLERIGFTTSILSKGGHLAPLTHPAETAEHVARLVGECDS